MENAPSPPQAPAAQKPQTIPAPAYCNIAPGEMLPMRGFNWKVVGYTKDFEMVLKCEGMTGKRRKEIERRKK